MTNFQIRPATADEFSTAIDWAAAEGWNPGLEDLPVFHGTDPQGFIMGFVDGEPVSSISVVRYGSDLGFLGFYIVHPDFRGRGYGLATWEAGLVHLQNRIIGLDGVVDQQDNYRKSGFTLTGRNIRHTGIPDITGSPKTAIVTEQFSPSHLPALHLHDQQIFTTPRDSFLRGWTTPGAANSRTTRVALQDGELAGYGTIRQCRDGYKIGPLFANDEPVAETLFSDLVASVPHGSAISLDTPEANVGAVALAVRHGLQPVFETARMYKGDATALPIQKIFGITSFELG